jgi:glutamate N-acetyltransferase/amino-acid N-acetyltransferase
MINIPKGFKWFSQAVGMKEPNSDGSLKRDFAIMLADKPVAASAVFTRNQFCGENIVINREQIKDNELQALFVNAGIANVATGKQGQDNVRSIIKCVSEKFSVQEKDVLVGETGKIGPQLPMEKIYSGFKNFDISEFGTSEEDINNFVRAIMTTDTHVKLDSVEIVVDGEKYSLLGVCKGSGMIEPNMATMLAYFWTDYPIGKNQIHNVLKTGVDLSFNMISVDTDTSTSDTVALFSSGDADIALEPFQEAFNSLAKRMAKMIVKDGEGASKLLEAHVSGAKTENDAKEVAKSIINSPLIKTAIFGQDPNWGRLIMAVGKCFDISFDKYKLSLGFGDWNIFRENNEISENIPAIEEYLKGDEIVIKVDLGLGNYSAEAYGCDLSYDYVHINADYTT